MVHISLVGSYQPGGFWRAVALNEACAYFLLGKCSAENNTQLAGLNMALKKVTGPGTTPRFSSILKSPFLWNLQPLQNFEVMELKGGKPKCMYTPEV